ncbi:MAG: tripartite tricarboxylate transporter substrate binding protein [Pseudomonadota bacterium]
MKLTSILAAAAIALSGQAALADDYPERPITHVFPWSAAGPAYAASQAVADRMSEILNVQIGMQARTGAGGMNAFRQAMAEPADGYTVIDGWVAPLVIAPLAGRSDFTLDDFIPLNAVLASPFAIMVRADDDRFPDFESLAAFIAENPGQIRYSGGGDLGLPHQVTALVFQGQNLVARHVPYQGMSDAVRDLRSGILDFIVANAGQYRANTGEVRAIAAISDDPAVSDALYDGAPLITDIFDNVGPRDLSLVGWTWWLVKAGTPMDRVEVLRAAQAEAMADPEVQATLTQLGFTMLDFGHDQYESIVSQTRTDLAAAVEAIEWEREQLAAQ